MEEKSMEQFLFEYCLTPSSAAFAASSFGCDMEVMETITRRWHDETLPYLSKLSLVGMIRKEISRRIAFGEKRLADLMVKYDNPRIPFADRRFIMEVQVPVVEEALAQYKIWHSTYPVLDRWTPFDVAQIKRAGIEEFIRFNLPRFYGRIAEPTRPQDDGEEESRSGSEREENGGD